MRAVSQAFLDAVASSHTIVHRVDVLQARATIMEGLPLAGGQVVLDRTAEIRGRGTGVRIGGRDGQGNSLLPAGATDLLTPFGNELQVWSGVRLSTGDELVSLGIFGIGQVTVDDPGASVTVDGFDRAQLVADADFESTEVIPAGTNGAEAIRQLIDNGVPGLLYRFADIADVTPLLVYSDDSAGARWSSALALATSFGCDLYLDGDGAVVLEAVPDPEGDPDVNLHDGPGGVVISAPKKWDRGPAFNAVIAYSDNPQPGVTPARAIARDLDPTSPTYYYGPFGRKPKRLPGPYTSNGQAQTAADAALRATLGIAQTLDLSIAPNPALEAGDLASVRRMALSIDEIDVLDTLTIDLGVGAMSATCRARQVTR